MKKTVVVICVIAAVIAVLIGVAALMHHCGVKAPEFRIFGSLDELSCFDGYETEEIPDRQDLTEGLEIKARNCFKVVYEGSEYYVYGYLFASPDDASLFSERFRNTDRSSMASYIIEKDERVLLYYGGVWHGRSFKEHLFESLTEKVEVFYPEDGE